MKTYRFKILIFISFGFVIYFLKTNDIFKTPEIYSVNNLVISVVFLWLSFIVEALMWKRILNPDFRISSRDAIASVGLSIFTKYIPGKVLVILGRAEYIRKKYDYPIKALINRSFHAQILAIFAALIVGGISVFLFDDVIKHIVLIVLGLIIIGIFIFTPVAHESVENIVARLFKKDISIPNLNRKEAASALPLYLLYWVILSFGFYFFICSFMSDSPLFLTGFVFPLAVVFGIVVIIAPGGIGFREGLLAGLLHLSGLEIGLATSIALISRLWFLSGEFFLFTLGLFFRKNKG